MEMRTCTGCGEEKPLTAEYFYIDRSSASGYRCECKICRNKINRKYREENPDRAKIYYKDNREKVRAGQKKWREANPEKVRAGQKKWREENTEQAHAGQKKWYEENREKVRVRHKKWRKENPDYIKKWHIENPHYTRDKRRNDPTYRLHSNLRGGLWSCLSGKQKKSHTMQYIGLDLESLWKYFESKFTDGMTRENHGEWHVDHVRPLCSFDFDQFEQGSEEYENLIHEAWHYTNLQPLWAKDNMSKSGKWEAEEGVELGVE